jgi:hypothetical protein
MKDIYGFIGRTIAVGEDGSRSIQYAVADVGRIFNENLPFLNLA